MLVAPMISSNPAAWQRLVASNAAAAHVVLKLAFAVEIFGSTVFKSCATRLADSHFGWVSGFWTACAVVGCVGWIVVELAIALILRKFQTN